MIVRNCQYLRGMCCASKKSEVHFTLRKRMEIFHEYQVERFVTMIKTNWQTDGKSRGSLVVHSGLTSNFISNLEINTLHL